VGRTATGGFECGGHWYYAWDTRLRELEELLLAADLPSPEEAEEALHVLTEGAERC